MRGPPTLNPLKDYGGWRVSGSILQTIFKLATCYRIDSIGMSKKNSVETQQSFTQCFWHFYKLVCYTRMVDVIICIGLKFQSKLKLDFYYICLKSFTLSDIYLIQMDSQFNPITPLLIFSAVRLYFLFSFATHLQFRLLCGFRDRNVMLPKKPIYIAQCRSHTANGRFLKK